MSSHKTPPISTPQDYSFDSGPFGNMLSPFGSLVVSGLGLSWVSMSSKLLSSRFSRMSCRQPSSNLIVFSFSLVRTVLTCWSCLRVESLVRTSRRSLWLGCLTASCYLLMRFFSFHRLIIYINFRQWLFPLHRGESPVSWFRFPSWSVVL